MDTPKALKQRKVHDCDLPAFKNLGAPDRVMDYLPVGPVTAVVKEALAQPGEFVRPYSRHLVNYE